VKGNGGDRSEGFVFNFTSFASIYFVFENKLVLYGKVLKLRIQMFISLRTPLLTEVKIMYKS
jgi:hypothetical protein